jgi:lycopene beta-cyclase
MNTTHYDWAIIGAGAAGMQLALAMIEEGVLTDKKLLIIDKDWNFEAARTWCFWEKGPGKYDALLTKTWHSGLFRPKGSEIKLDLGGYAYKMTRVMLFKTPIEGVKGCHSVFWGHCDNSQKLKAFEQAIEQMGINLKVRE